MGGCVRDLLLGREPKDYDVATDARPEQHRRPVSRTRAWWARISAWCWSANGAQVEVATFRSDLEYDEAAVPRACVSNRPARRTPCAAISRSTACCWIPISGEMFDYVDGRGRSARRRDPRDRRSRCCAFRKTICACCARCVSRRGFIHDRAGDVRGHAAAAPSIRARFAPSGCGMNWSAFSPKAARGADSNCWTRAGC